MNGQSDQLARLLLRQEFEEFLYHEAELLDQRRYEDWLKLIAEDIRYWMPMRRNVKVRRRGARVHPRRPRHQLVRRGSARPWKRRVRQIMTGIHWAEEPVSRITHIVSNVQLLEATPSVADAAEVAAKCRFLVDRNRVETETDILVGKREDRLRRAGEGWQIARRKIILDQNVLMTKNLTFFF